MAAVMAQKHHSRAVEVDGGTFSVFVLKLASSTVRRHHELAELADTARETAGGADRPRVVFRRLSTIRRSCRIVAPGACRAIHSRGTRRSARRERAVQATVALRVRVRFSVSRSSRVRAAPARRPQGIAGVFFRARAEPLCAEPKEFRRFREIDRFEAAVVGRGTLGLFESWLTWPTSDRLRRHVASARSRSAESRRGEVRGQSPALS